MTFFSDAIIGFAVGYFVSGILFMLLYGRDRR